MEKPSPSPFYYPTIFQGFGIVVLFILLSMLTGLLMTLGYLTGNTFVVETTEMLGYLLAAGGTLIFVTRVKVKIYRETPALVHQPVRPVNFPIVVVLTLLGMMAIDPLSALIPMPEDVRELFDQMFSKSVPAFITAVIFAPILEELIFRGIVLEGFLKNYLPVKAILWTNILFGLSHLNPWQFIGAFLLGILISWVYQKTRNLVLPVVMHMVNNLLSFLFLYVADVPFSEVSLADIMPSPSFYYTLVAASVLLLGFFFLFLARRFPVQE